MSSVLKMAREAVGIGPASRVKKGEATKAANDSDIERLKAQLEEADVEFKETFDPVKVGRIEASLVAAQSLRKRIADGLEKARADLAAEQAAEAARLLAAKHERLRVEAARFGESIVEKTVELIKLYSGHEAIVDELPPSERFQNWPADYTQAANKAAEKASPPKFVKTGGFTRASNPPRVIDLQLVVPIETVD